MIQFHLSAKQAQAWHAVVNGFGTGLVTYLADALGRMALGGPAVIFRSLIVGAIITGLSRAAGAWLRARTAGG